MLFNSLNFAVFFAGVFLLYLILRDHLKWQNRMLLVASCIFYGTWDWRFLALMFVSITTDFFCAKEIDRSSDPRARRFYLILNVVVSLGLLGFFKYFNFFADNLEELLSALGIHSHHAVLQIILPVGISFYTFQAMSYVFDVYRKILAPVKNYWDYALFVTYFPQLVAGPIMKAKDLLPQILNKRVMTVSQFYEGCYLIFWGLFQKIVIADNLAKVVDPIFASAAPYNGMKVLIAVYAFSFQIYCDFSGYSNIARGLGKCMGFDIMVNFNLPYFVTNPVDFWRRWNISLSVWLRDYLYIPLGGNRRGMLMTCRNLFITMLLGGLWHGASWTFVMWGTYHGILLILYKGIERLPHFGRLIKKTFIDPMAYFIKALFFFQLICFGWLLFRARSTAQAIEMLQGITSNFVYVKKQGIEEMFFTTLCFSGILIAVQLVEFIRKDKLAIFKAPVIIKAFFYLLLFCLMLLFGEDHAKEFIYFQF